MLKLMETLFFKLLCRTPDLHKGLQCHLALSALGPVAKDYGKGLAFRDGLELLVEPFTLICKNCSVGFDNGRSILAPPEDDVFGAFR